MKNLKRIFSLALAIVMVMGMMVVGASATDFIDDADIEHGAAADTMAALKIIGGYEDGSFRPNGDVTRAEMAKMISVALNGGNNPNVGLPTTPTYTDVKLNDWFAEYVEYCSNLGIIGGRGNGIFDPYGKVTAAEAAKMILVALGFDAETFELGGANWSTNTMRLAQSLRIGDSAEDAEPLSLFDGIASIAANTPLNRDQAAQLIYNGIQSNTVLMAITGVTGNGNNGILGSTTGTRPVYDWSLTGKSLLVTKFGATVAEGVLTGASLSAGTWTYEVTDATDQDNKAVDLTAITFTKDVSDYYMQSVRVIYKTNTGGRKTVLTITPVGEVMDTCAWADLSKNAKNATLNGFALGINTGDDVEDGETYTTSNLPVHTFLGAKSTLGAASYKEYDKAQLIDNDGDGRIDCVVVTPITVTTVSTVRASYVQLKSVGNVTLASNIVEEGLEAGDYVTYTQHPITKVYTVCKAETVTGLMNSTMIKTGSTRKYDRVQLAGEWYNVVNGKFESLRTLVGGEALLVLVSGYVVDGKSLEGTTVTTSPAVMAVAHAKDTTTSTTSVDGGTEYLEVRVLNADGTTSVLKVSTIEGAKVNKDDGDARPVIGQLYTYKTVKGYQVLTEYDPHTTLKEGSNPVYYDKIQAETITIKEGVATAGTKTFRFDDDATIFVMVGRGTSKLEETAADGTTYVTLPMVYGVVSGADVNKWGDQTTSSVIPGDSFTGKEANDQAVSDASAASVSSALYANRASNGFTYVQEGALIFTNLAVIPGVSGNTKLYGYVTGASYYTQIGTKTYIAVPLWNGSENVTVLAEKEKDANTDAEQNNEKLYPIGSLVTYMDNGDGTANSLNSLPGSANAVVAWDEVRGTIKFLDETERTVDSKTNVIFVDGYNKAGAEGTIQLAEYIDPELPGKGLEANVRYVEFDGTNNKHVAVLILETVVSVDMVGGSTTAFTEKTADKTAAKNALKELHDGLYTVDVTQPDNKGMHDLLEELDGIEEKPITFFKFTCNDSESYTLKLYKNGGSEPALTETLSGEKAIGTVGIFYYNTEDISAGSYQYYITDAEDNVLEAGSFVIKAQ